MFEVNSDTFSKEVLLISKKKSIKQWITLVSPNIDSLKKLDLENGVLIMAVKVLFVRITKFINSTV